MVTFLPKTNLVKTFAERLQLRADKGRVFGLGVHIDPFELIFGVQWVDGTASTFVQLTDKVAKSASFTGGVSPFIYRHRIQTRPTGGDGTITNGSWTSYDGTRGDVTVTLPATGVDLRFQAQGKDDAGAIVNSFTGWFAVLAA